MSRHHSESVLLKFILEPVYSLKNNTESIKYSDKSGKCLTTLTLFHNLLLCPSIKTKTGIFFIFRFYLDVGHSHAYCCDDFHCGDLCYPFLLLQKAC